MKKLTEWIPDLAQEVYGKKYSPNCDLILHLEAQQTARPLGIQWAFEMPAADVAQLQEVIRAKYSRKVA